MMGRRVVTLVLILAVLIFVGTDATVGFRPLFLGDLFCEQDFPSLKPKRLNDSCNSTIECSGFSGPVICSDKKICECAPGFYASKGSDQGFERLSQVFGSVFSGQDDNEDEYVCRPLPSLYQPCTTQCAPPLQCVGDNEDGFESSTPRETGRFTTTPYERETSDREPGTRPTFTEPNEEFSSTTPFDGSFPTTSGVHEGSSTPDFGGGGGRSTPDFNGGEGRRSTPDFGSTGGRGTPNRGSGSTGFPSGFSTTTSPEEEIEITGPSSPRGTRTPSSSNGDNGDLSDSPAKTTPGARRGGNDRIQRDFVLGDGSGPWIRPWYQRERAAFKTCKCLPPYQLINFQCQLKCKETEFFAEGKCRRRCTDEEVRLPNFECKPRVALGESCGMDEQCTAAFSGCINGKCGCRPGFSGGGKGCSPQVAHCEFGEPLRSGGSGDGGGFTQCTYTGPSYDPSSILKATGLDRAFPQAQVITISAVGLQDFSYPEGDMDKKNGCPDDHFCHPFENPVTTRSASGFCCPKPKKMCPVGEPHPTANCTGQVFAAAAVGGVPPDLVCPDKTHYCYQKVGSVIGPVCCPRACARGLVLSSDGQCLSVVEIGGKCQRTEQCGGNSVCEGGTCACPNKTVLIENFQTPRKYCSAQCDPINEINYNNKCFTRKKLGEPCKGQEFRCPLTAICGPKGTCQCPCGRVQINESLCADPPRCPQRLSNEFSNPFLTSGSFGNAFSQFFGGDGGDDSDQDRGQGEGRGQGQGREQGQGHGHGQGQGQRQILGQGRGQGQGQGQDQNGPDRRRSGSSRAHGGPRRTAAELYANATLCRVGGQSAPTDRAVDKCPSEQVCLRYLDNMGVCCPRPEPYCPNGARPLGSCNPQPGTDECDAGSVCFQYITPANPNSKEGHVCCPTPRLPQVVQPSRGFGPVFAPVLGDQAQDGDWSSKFGK